VDDFDLDFDFAFAFDCYCYCDYAEKLIIGGRAAEHLRHIQF
jgi:hypothetical protein